MSTGMALDKIGRYEIVGQLGKGAMGVVYRALDPTIGRTVALKTMRLDVQGPDSSELLARFRNEARLAGVLNHPNIVTIYDAGEMNGLFYMAMEYIEGKTLYQVMLQEHALSPETVLDLSRQICAGLDAASSQRVVHRDIKPANIMILPSGTVKITDFGIAKSGGSMTSTGEVLGTPNYMSPEQVKGKALDGRSDLFSFGVILYEMITGEKPFAGDNITTIIYKIVNEDPIPPRELNPEIHPGLNRVILKALAKNPQDRFQMGADLVQALENYETLPEEEEPPKPIPAGVFEFPQQAALQATVKTPAPVRTPNGVPAVTKAATGKATAARGVVTRTPTKKPLVAQKSIPLLPVVIGVLIAIIVGVSFAIVYVKHEHAKQQEEMARLQQQQQQQQNTSPAVDTPVTSQPGPSVTPVPSTQPDSSQPAADTNTATSETSPWRSGNKHRNANHTSPVTTQPSAMLASGQLVLSSDPDGAEVKIDGVNQPDWRTPFTATAVPPGPHTLTFTKNGYSIETRVAEVSAGKQAFVKVNLKAGTATVSLNSDPPGASVLIDDREIAKTTPTQIVLGRGMHSIGIRKPGYQESSTNVDLQEGQQFNFAPTLKPLNLEGAKESHGNIFSRVFGGGNSGDRVGVEVHTVPRGAQISVNGQLYSKTTPTKLALPPGEYEIILQLPGYKPLHKTLTVEKGPAIRIEETMQK